MLNFVILSKVRVSLVYGLRGVTVIEVDTNREMY